MAKNTLITLLALALSVFAAGCSDDAETTTPASPEDKVEQRDGKADAWDHRNSPGSFRLGALEYNIEKLPMSGQSLKRPWADTYWPTYEDSINVRWDGEQLSPAEKYDTAYNGWEASEGFSDLKPYTADNCADKSWDQEYYDKLGPLATYVSKSKGNWKAHDGLDNDDDGEIDECEDRDGVESWWGLCHAWVPASILEDEPLEAVEHNGITFEVADIKALLQLSYDSTQAYMLGGRCNIKADEIKRDDEGRIIEEQRQCRDTNAGSLHVIMTNMLGVQQRPFAMDRTYDYQVWNQPVVGYDITKQEELTLEEALELLNVEPAEGEEDATPSYPYNSEAKRWFEVKADLEYIVESEALKTPTGPELAQFIHTDRLHYILETDEEGTIIGGEPLSLLTDESDNGRRQYDDWPDFLWLPVAPRTRYGVDLDLEEVRELVRKSRASLEPTIEELLFSSDDSVEIPDNDTKGAESVILADKNATIKTLEVSVDISHTWKGDLEVIVEHGGIEVVVHSRGGGSKDDIKETYTLNEFDGASIEGEWKLKVNDNYAYDTGTINSWSIKTSSTVE